MHLGSKRAKTPLKTHLFKRKETKKTRNRGVNVSFVTGNIARVSSREDSNSLFHPKISKFESIMTIMLIKQVAIASQICLFGSNVRPILKSPNSRNRKSSLNLPIIFCRSYTLMKPALMLKLLRSSRLRI